MLVIIFCYYNHLNNITFTIYLYNDKSPSRRNMETNIISCIFLLSLISISLYIHEVINKYKIIKENFQIFKIFLDYK